MMPLPAAALPHVEDSPRWWRARLRGEVAVESKRARLLYEAGRLPRLFFPEDDVRFDLVPGTSIERLEDVPELDGFVHVDWKAMDAWLEEDEVAFGHVRDPYHRLDVRHTSRHVRVLVDGETVADSTRTVALFETGLPTRWYFPPEDVRMDLLERSGVVTTCAYKGYAPHFSLEGEPNIAWTYDDAQREVAPIEGRICFYDEWVDVEVDGEPQERPVTPFKRLR
jgi:uncharacterized protein (DUF427 family)